MKLEIHRARVNVKSLAAEATIIKQEISKLSANCKEFVGSNLRNHKAQKVKPEARLAHLALGFLKGVPKSKVESSKKPIDAINLYRKISKFCWGVRNVTQVEVTEWLQT